MKGILTYKCVFCESKLLSKACRVLWRERGGDLRYSQPPLQSCSSSFKNSTIKIAISIHISISMAYAAVAAKFKGAHSNQTNLQQNVFIFHLKTSQISSESTSVNWKTMYTRSVLISFIWSKDLRLVAVPTGRGMMMLKGAFMSWGIFFVCMGALKCLFGQYLAHVKEGLSSSLCCVCVCVCVCVEHFWCVGSRIVCSSSET